MRNMLKIFMPDLFPADISLERFLRDGGGQVARPTVMANTAGQRHAIILTAIGQHRRPVARSNWLLLANTAGMTSNLRSVTRLRRSAKKATPSVLSRPVARSKWLFGPTPQPSAMLQVAVMADTTGQWYALRGFYGPHRRPVVRSMWQLWPTLHTSDTL